MSMLEKIFEFFNGVRIKKASKYYEVTKVLVENLSRPVLIEDVDGYPLIGNLYASRKDISKWFSVRESDLTKVFSTAIRNRENVEIFEFKLKQQSFSLLELPVPKYYPMDGGQYFTSSVVVAESNGKRNLSYHRIMIIDEERGAIRLVERDLYKMWKRAIEGGEELRVAVCVGLEPTFALAAATSVAWEIDESTIASSLRYYTRKEREKIAKTPFGIHVPANVEMVFEAKITSEKVEREGPFVDITGTYDVQENQPVIVFEKLYAVDNFHFHAILPAGYEHKNLMGMPREASIYSTLRDRGIDVLDVRLTAGGCSWLHGVAKIRKKREDDGKKAIEYAFEAHKSMKHFVVVDEDINIDNVEEIEWAIATRVQAKEDAVIRFEKGSSLDPSAFENDMTYKVGIDATRPLGRDLDFKKVKVVDFHLMIETLRKFLPESEFKAADPYSILVATLISHRTKDEVTYEAAKRILSEYPTVEALANADECRLSELIYPAGFYRQKAKRLKTIAKIITEKYDGRIPSDFDSLISLPGVGRKTANIVLSRGYGKDAIAVDTHVHRISNRLGIVNTKNPEETEIKLKEVLPRNLWKDFNEIMVLFGRNICKPINPRCEYCPISDMCMKIGVT